MVDGRFVAWCLLLAGCLVVLVGGHYLLDYFELTGWRRLVAAVPVLIAMRFSIQRFLAKGRK